MVHQSNDAINNCPTCGKLLGDSRAIDVSTILPTTAPNNDSPILFHRLGMKVDAVRRSSSLRLDLQLSKAPSHSLSCLDRATAAELAHADMWSILLAEAKAVPTEVQHTLFGPNWFPRRFSHGLGYIPPQ